MSKRAVEIVAEAANFAYKQADRKINEAAWSGIFSGRLIELVLSDVLDICDNNPQFTSKELAERIKTFYELD